MSMRLSVLNSLILGLLLAFAVASGVLTLWHSHRSAFWDHRIALAQDSYAEHLLLQSNINRLFKQHADSLLFGDLDEGRLEDEIEREIAGNMAAIRNIILREIALVGEEEFEELDVLARIEDDVRSLTRSLQRLAEDGTLLAPDVRREQLIRLMDEEIDGRLAMRISEALAEERDEVAETSAAASAFRAQVRSVVWGLIALSVALATGAALIYQRGVVLPARNVMRAVERYQRGDFDETPLIGGVQEFRGIGVVLGRMAERLRERELSQAEQTRVLEEAVNTRTIELSRVVAQIEMAEASRRQMMADVSHELRTPLTIIQGEADVSLRGGTHPVDVYRDSLVRIRDTSKHASAIVDDLMLIARQEAGKLRLELIEVDLCDLARDTVRLASQSIVLDLNVPQANVRADPIRIRQSILALMQNALRYGGETIVLRIETSEMGYRIMIEDDGPGMSGAEKAEAFDRFYRGSNAAAPGIEGTGLGLAIVRSIAVAHGGMAGVDDRPGGGLRAWIDLPPDRPLKLVVGGEGSNLQGRSRAGGSQ